MHSYQPSALQKPKKKSHSSPKSLNPHNPPPQPPRPLPSARLQQLRTHPLQIRLLQPRLLDLPPAPRALPDLVPQRPPARGVVHPPAVLAPGPRLRAAHLPADDGGAGLGDEQLDEAERRAQLVGAREEVEEGARVDDGDARGERRERRGRERGGERMSAARKCGSRGRVASSRKRVWPVRRACQLGLEGVSGEDDGPRERNSGRMSLP